MMVRNDCPDDLQALQSPPGTAVPWVDQLNTRYGASIVALAAHCLPRIQPVKDVQRDVELRYDVVEAFINHADSDSGEWQKSGGTMRDRPRLENAFAITADRQGVSKARVKQACTMAYDTEERENKPEQFLQDVLQIEYCYHEMED